LILFFSGKKQKTTEQEEGEKPEGCGMRNRKFTIMKNPVALPPPRQPKRLPPLLRQEGVFPGSDIHHSPFTIQHYEEPGRYRSRF
jgi:hypothetical protein